MQIALSHREREGPIGAKRRWEGEGSALAVKKRPNPNTSRARVLRRDSTDAERAMWRLLRSRRLVGHKFRRQLPIGPYIADFACFEGKLVVELDGGQHGIAIARDAARTRAIERHGFRVVRFWNNDVLANPEGVLTMILQALEEVR
ncbi:MAG: endonuclease domain-containing protein [Alphaproteobacteria bacterium]|nr:endonuclease domain-containing protein [Alphaproteobacteria bacterium]